MADGVKDDWGKVARARKDIPTLGEGEDVPRSALTRKPTFFATDEEYVTVNQRRLGSNGRVPFQALLRATWLHLCEDEGFFEEMMAKAAKLPVGRRSS